MKIARWSKKDRRRGISEEGEEAGGSKGEADAGAGWTGIISILRLLHPHSGSLRKATNGLGYCTSVCYRRGGGESESNNTSIFFLEKLVSRDLQNKPKLAEGKNHS